MNWKLTWGEVTFGPEDLTAGDLAFVDGWTRCGWQGFLTLPTPRIAADLIAVVVARRTGRPLDEVAAEVASASAAALIGAVDTSVDPPPAEPAEPVAF